MFCSFEANKTWDLSAEKDEDPTRLNLVLLPTMLYIWEWRLPASL